MIKPSLAIVLAATLVGSAGLAARANDTHRNFDISQIASDPSLIVNAQADDESEVEDISDTSEVDQNDQVVITPVNYPVAVNDGQADGETNDDAVVTPVYQAPGQYQPVPGQYQYNDAENGNVQAGQQDEQDQNQSDEQENDSEGN